MKPGGDGLEDAGTWLLLKLVVGGMIPWVFDIERRQGIAGWDAL